MRNIFFTFFISLLLISSQAFSYDIEAGVWKSINEKYDYNSGDDKLISGMLVNRIYHSNNFDSDNRNKEFKDTYLESVLGVNLKLSKYFSIKTVSKFEPVNNSKSTPDGSNRFFENHGAYLDEIILQFDYKKFSALAGKMRVNFGDGWRADIGIWINGLDDKRYRQSEKLGIGAIQKFGDEKAEGEYVFGLSFFTNDRKNFDNSIISKRDEVSKSDGKVGDTRGLDSFNISLDIFYDFGEKEKLSYHFAYLSLAANPKHSSNPQKADDEGSVVGNFRYKYPLSDNILLDSFAEFVQTNNLEGNRDKDSKILTFNFTTYFYQNYFLGLARGIEEEKEVATNGINRQINEINFGYQFNDAKCLLNGLRIALGYAYNEVDYKTRNEKDQSFGFLITHKIEF